MYVCVQSHFRFMWEVSCENLAEVCSLSLTLVQCARARDVLVTLVSAQTEVVEACN